MPFEALVLKVLIASPGDTEVEREAIEGAMRGWNGDRAEREQRVLLPKRWELDSVPLLGGRGQALINEQLVDPADIVIAIFDARLGTNTPEAVSGTAEEILRASSAGKPVHVWFSEEDIPRTADLKQLEALQQFRKELAAQGLVGTYSSSQDLAFKVRSAIERDLQAFDQGGTRVPIASAGVNFAVEYKYDVEPRTDSRGRVSQTKRNRRIVARNTGHRAAHDTTIRLESLTADEPPLIHDDGARPNIGPGDEFSWTLLTAAGWSSSLSVIFDYREGDEYKTLSRPLSLR